MLKPLVKLQLRSAAQGILRLAKPKKKMKAGGKILFALLFIYIAAALSFSLGFYFHTLLGALQPAGLVWLYFALAGIAAFVFGLLGSVFLAQSSLYQARDNAQLLSLPIKPGLIYASRVIVLYLITLFAQALILVPAMAVYLIFHAGGLAGLPAFLACALLLPLPVLALALPLGSLLALVSSKIRRKNLMITLFSLAFLTLYMVLYGRVMADMQRLLQNAAQIAGSVRGAAFPAYHLGLAIAERKGPSLLLFALCCLFPFALSAFLASRRYESVLTTVRGTAAVLYKGGGIKARGQLEALTKKEMKRFFGSPVYLMNAGIGLIFMLALPFVLLFDNSVLGTIRGLGILSRGQEGLAAAGILSMLAGSAFISAASISLEGKQLWIAQSLPIAPSQWLKSKALAHTLICLVPILVSAFTLAFILKLGPAEALFCLILPALTAVFCALTGLIINLRFPKLNWQSETEPVKQSLSTFLAMSLGFLFPAALAALYVIVLMDTVSPLAYGLICLALLLGLNLLLWRHLKKGAGDAMKDLSEA